MIYSGTIEARTGHSIPTYGSGKPAHSKYNPVADKIPLGENASGCIVVFGIAGGFHIKNLLANDNILKLIAVEEDKESLEFCSNFECVKEIKKDSRVVLCSTEDFQQCVGNNYLPSLHKKLTTLFLRSWHDEIPDAEEKAAGLLKSTLDSISTDISVQAHFGRHWHINILSNLRFMGNTGFLNKPVKIPAGKTKAAIIAAGPTLDDSIEILKEQRSSTYIVSTDTAYGTLTGYGITPDAVVSVDAQQVSSEHFIGVKKSDTAFIFDISSNPEAVKTIWETGNTIYFVRSHHPLAALVADQANIPLAESGSGTVTIAAADWAKQQNFKELVFYGADFAYSDGKPYCRGTYLEKRFNSTSSRTSTSEEKYSSLMFRTELEKAEGGLLGNLGKSPVTSKVLASYGMTLLEWASRHDLVRKGNAFTNKTTVAPSFNPTTAPFDYGSFIKNYVEKVQSLQKNLPSMSPSETAKEILETPELLSLLPLFAAFGKETIVEDISLALQLLLYYNL